jgi:predicted PurR-regulated permease PerM
MNKQSAEQMGTLDALVSQRAQGVLLLILATLALATAAFVAKPFLAPVLFALVVGVVVAPVADRLYLIGGVPRIVTGSALLVIVIGLLLVTFIMLEPLLTAMINQWPKIRAEIQIWVFRLSDVLRGIETLSSEIEETVGVSDEEPTTAIPSLMDAIWLAPGIGAKFFIFVGTLFFFVLTRDEVYALSRRYRLALFEAERVVARYFATVTLINIGLGTTTAVVLMLIGVDGAIMWGLAAGVLNYILYLGPLVMAFSLLVAGMIQFQGAMILLPPFAFLCINLTEAQFVTPALVGQRMDLNPLGVFLAITFGLWLWGPLGAIVALPLALWVTVLLRQMAATQALAVDRSAPKPE